MLEDNVAFVQSSYLNRSTKKLSSHSIHNAHARSYVHPSSPTQSVKSNESSPHSSISYHTQLCTPQNLSSQSVKHSQEFSSHTAHSYPTNHHYQQGSTTVVFNTESQVPLTPSNHTDSTTAKFNTEYQVPLSSSNHTDSTAVKFNTESHALLPHSYHIDVHTHPAASTTSSNQENPNMMAASNSKHRMAISSLINYPHHFGPAPRSSGHVSHSPSQVPNITTHRASNPHTDVSIMKYQCDQCDKIFIHYDNVRKHKKAVHERSGIVNMHVGKIHHKECTISCDQCDRAPPLR